MGTMLLTPLALMADDHHDKRYYDKSHKDYHQGTTTKIRRITNTWKSATCSIAIGIAWVARNSSSTGAGATITRIRFFLISMSVEV